METETIETLQEENRQLSLQVAELQKALRDTEKQMDDEIRSAMRYQREQQYNSYRD